MMLPERRRFCAAFKTFGMRDAAGFEMKPSDQSTQPLDRFFVEDIVSTGLSARECIEAVRKLGADVVGLGCLIDRSGGKAEIGAPVTALAALNVKAWPADALPEHLRHIPAVKPGSRGVSQ